MKPFAFASSAYESSLLAIKILSLGIPESLRFWACAAPWFPNLIGISQSGKPVGKTPIQKYLPKENYLLANK
jgi:hypothetical protein